MVRCEMRCLEDVERWKDAWTPTFIDDGEERKRMGERKSLEIEMEIVENLENGGKPWWKTVENRGHPLFTINVGNQERGNRKGKGRGKRGHPPFMILLTKSGYMRGGRRIEETDETGGQNKSTECRPAEQSPAWRYSRGTGMDR